MPWKLTKQTIKIIVQLKTEIATHVIKVMTNLFKKLDKFKCDNFDLKQHNDILYEKNQVKYEVISEMLII